MAHFLCVMLIVIMLIVVMPSVARLSVAMLNMAFILVMLGVAFSYCNAEYRILLLFFLCVIMLIVFYQVLPC